MPSDTTPREDSDAITTSDGDIRQLEKADLVRNRPDTAPHAPDPAMDPDWGTVRSLGKSGEGAPEEDAANNAEVGTDAVMVTPTAPVTPGMNQRLSG